MASIAPTGEHILVLEKAKEEIMEIRVLVPLDGSPLAEQALPYARVVKIDQIAIRD